MRVIGSNWYKHASVSFTVSHNRWPMTYYNYRLTKNVLLDCYIVHYLSNDTDFLWQILKISTTVLQFFFTKPHNIPSTFNFIIFYDFFIKILKFPIIFESKYGKFPFSNQNFTEMEIIFNLSRNNQKLNDDCTTIQNVKFNHVKMMIQILYSYHLWKEYSSGFLYLMHPYHLPPPPKIICM